MFAYHNLLKNCLSIKKYISFMSELIEELELLVHCINNSLPECELNS